MLSQRLFIYFSFAPGRALCPFPPSQQETGRPRCRQTDRVETKGPKWKPCEWRTQGRERCEVQRPLGNVTFGLNPATGDSARGRRLLWNDTSGGICRSMHYLTWLSGTSPERTSSSRGSYAGQKGGKKRFYFHSSSSG